MIKNKKIQKSMLKHTDPESSLKLYKRAIHIADVMINRMILKMCF